MATLFLDLENGNDALDGTTFSNRWKTVTSGATAARIAPGDTIRLMGALDPTSLGQNATWTNLSKTVTLTSAVTANIDDGEIAWTASANVTSTADTAQFKENTKSSKHVIATAFTTGLCAYKATGTLDLSGYQQVSFWLYNTVAIAASTLSLRLCTDTAGATSVHTVVIPAIDGSNAWIALTVNLATNLNAAIASVALYQDTDIAAVTIQLDNIIAVKAAASADSLSLTSLIGKVWNLVWAVSTTYAVNDIRKPTQPNRNGYRYKVTAQTSASGATEPTWPQEIGVSVVDGGVTWQCEGLEDTWYSPQSINGTTIKIDNVYGTLGNAGLGYSGTTETLTTYKRQPIILPYIASTIGFQLNDSGTVGNHIVFSGGWNRTDMSTQTGETWISWQSGTTYGVWSNGAQYWTFTNISMVRGNVGLHMSASPKSVGIYNCHFNHCVNNAVNFNTLPAFCTSQGVACHNNGGTGFLINNNGNGFNGTLRAIASSSNLSGSGIQFYTLLTASKYIRIVDAVLKNNAVHGLYAQQVQTFTASGLLSANNATSGVNAGGAGDVFLINSLLSDSTPITTVVANNDTYIFSQKNGQVADAHLLTTDAGTIISATDQRHTASGISWKFRPTSTTRNVDYPLRLSVAKVAVAANALVTLSIWTRRDNTNIQGQLFVAGGQIAGVGADLTVACAPSINTWVQSSNLTFTPTEAGVVEVLFRCWDGVGTTNNMWIDDFSAAQA